MNIATTMQQLYHDYGDLDGITIECQNELIAIGIENSQAKAEVFLQGAQISQYQRRNEKPLLWLSEANTFAAGSPLRGGIPLCWPWFGAIEKNPTAIQAQFDSTAFSALPFHGFIRQRVWHVERIETPTTDLTVIELRYSIEDNTETYWPFATTLRYRIEISDTLTAQLTTANDSQKTFAFSQALHSYYNVAHIQQTQIHGFEQSAYVDTLDDWSHNLQKGTVLIDEAVDRIYQSAPTITLYDGVRNIDIKNKNSHSTIVWNPWIEKAKQLPHYHAQDYETMLCIETANVLDDYVTLAAHEAHTLTLLLQ